MMEDALQGILLSCLMALVTSGIAYKLGLFKLPSFPRPPIRFIHLFSLFAIYFVLPIGLQFVLVKLNQISMKAQFLTIIAMLLTLFVYVRSEWLSVYKVVFKNRESPTSTSYDFFFGMLLWLVAFPWVATVSQFFDWILLVLFKFENYEQVAVKFLRENLTSPLQMTLALISVIIIAPLVEEVLFRGTLQQFLKKHFSIKTSILITAALFACFHFSPSQHLGNLSLIPSLFVFSCFLGFIYERQGSLFASIGLHAAFNLASSLQILFFPES